MACCLPPPAPARLCCPTDTPPPLDQGNLPVCRCIIVVVGLRNYNPLNRSRSQSKAIRKMQCIPPSLPSSIVDRSGSVRAWACCWVWVPNPSSSSHHPTDRSPRSPEHATASNRRPSLPTSNHPAPSNTPTDPATTCYIAPHEGSFPPQPGPWPGRPPSVRAGFNTRSNLGWDVDGLMMGMGHHPPFWEEGADRRS